MQKIQDKNPQYLLVKTGTGACDSIPYLDHWDASFDGGMCFYDFATAKQALCLLIKDELELLSEKYNQELREFKRDNPWLYQVGMSFLLSAKASHTIKKLSKMYHYYEVAKSSSSFEELDFKFFILSSDLSRVISLHFDIMTGLRVPEANGSFSDLYLLKSAEGEPFAIKKQAGKASLLESSELESMADSLQGRVDLLNAWAKNMEKKSFS